MLTNSFRTFKTKFFLILAYGLLAVFLAVFTLNASPLPVAGASNSPTTTTVGIVLPDSDALRWVQDNARLEAAFSAAGYSVHTLFSQNSSAIEKTNVETLIAEGIQVLVICPYNSGAAAAAVEAARAAGVKVIAYDRLILNTSALDYYITFDAISIGEAQAQYLVNHTAAPTGNPLFLYAGHAADYNAFLFFKGAWKILQPKIADGTFIIKNSSQAVSLQGNPTLSDAQEYQIIAQIDTNWNPTVAKNLATANLAALSKADKGKVSILAPNDGTARAIADAFTMDVDIQDYVITGQDAEKVFIQYMIDHTPTIMTVFKDVRTLTSDAAAAAITFLQGQTPLPTTTYNNGMIDVPSKASAVVSVDRHNILSALIDTGYYKISDFVGLYRSLYVPMLQRAPTGPGMDTER